MRINSLLRQAVRLVPSVVLYLSDAAKAETMGYEPIYNAYWEEIYDSVNGYLTGNKPVTSFRNRAAQAMSEAFTDAVYEAWYQADAELPLTDEVSAWLSERIGQERVNIENMFNRLKSEWEGLDPAAEAVARANGYASTLNALYGEAKLRAMKNQKVTWILGETEVHCSTCAKLAGKKHTIKYLLDNDYIPRKPDAGMDCHGYNCDCRIVDKAGNEVTL